MPTAWLPCPGNTKARPVLVWPMGAPVELRSVRALRGACTVSGRGMPSAAGDVKAASLGSPSLQAVPDRLHDTINRGWPNWAGPTWPGPQGAGTRIPVGGETGRAGGGEEG